MLADWLVRLGEQHGWYAQATSVPGVAQRTGATVYYVELFPPNSADLRPPVLALMPVPGDVDVVIASELIEAGRAVLRGLVTTQTVVVASTHRVYTIGEKSALGDGAIDPRPVLQAVRDRSRAFFGFDMQVAADATGSVISSVMLGALAASGALPFTREHFEGAVRESGVGVDDSLRGFGAGFAAARAPVGVDGEVLADPAEPTTALGREFRCRIETWLPAPLQSVAVEGVRRLLDYQDAEYAANYLDRLQSVVAFDHADRGWSLALLVARHLALWMSYEDVIRVADLKTRGERFRRVLDEAKPGTKDVVLVSEYMHPRFEEICDVLPAALGRRLLRSRRMSRILAPVFRDGRRISTTSLPGFLLLFAIAQLRRWRRTTMRHATEQAGIEAWLGTIRTEAATDLDFAAELATCQRLIKGYGDTHARGTRRFDCIMKLVPVLRGCRDPASAVKRLRDAALADEGGEAFERELSSLASLIS